MGFANHGKAIKVHKPSDNNGNPIIVRRSQKREQNKRVFSITKKSKITSLIIAAVLILTGVGILYRNSSPIPLNQTPKISDTLHFSDMVIPDGWSANSSIASDSKTSLSLAQNPPLLESSKNTCTYLRQIFYAPAYQAGRGDDFLTRSSLYQLAETNKISSPDLVKTKISTDKRPISLMSMTYEVPSSEKDGVIGKRSIAIRGIDKLSPLDETADNKGIPFISLTYDCKDSKDYDDNEWSTLVGSTLLSLFSQEPVVTTEEIGK